MDLKDKKILVTGGAGFLGTHVVRALGKRGVPSENIKVPRRTEFDLRRPADARAAVAGSDVVIHLAAVTGGIEFHRTHPGEIFLDNLLMGVELMEASRLAGVKKFVSVGSATEYPSDAPVPYEEKYLWEGEPDATHAPYSFAKRMLIVQGKAYRDQYGFDAVHLLPNNMYGPGEKPESGYVIPSLLRRVADAKDAKAPFIEVWGTGRAKREFLYAEDAAEGILLAAEKYSGAEPVNLGSGEEVSIRDLVSLIADGMGYEGEIRWDSSKPDGQLRRVLDVSRAEREFGFRARTPFAEGLKATIAWYLETRYK